MPKTCLAETRTETIGEQLRAAERIKGKTRKTRRGAAWPGMAQYGTVRYGRAQPYVQYPPRPASAVRTSPTVAIAP